MRRLPIVLAMLAFALPALADALGWQTYVNPRFGYSVDIPMAYLQQQTPSQNGDGQSFASAAGDAYVAVWGSNNALGWSLDQYYQAALARADVGTVTYKRKAAGWYVLSGYRTVDGATGMYEAIFYERLTIAADGSAISGVVILNAPSIKDKMEPVITRISRSLTPPGQGG